MLPTPWTRRSRAGTRSSSLPSFLSHIKDTAQNWRDTLHSQLPGSRDRVRQIRFAKVRAACTWTWMPGRWPIPIRRGGLAGEAILTTFDAHQWE